MRTARTGRKRRTAVWASLVALLGAVGFGAVTARQGGVIGGAKSALEPLPAIEGAASSSAGPSAPGREAGPLENPADPPSPADPPAPSSGATPDSSAAPTREAAVEEPTPAEDSPPASDGPGPRYAFLERLGLPAPPGGVIDAANSDARRLMDEAGERLSRPAVLTFRTEATVERVVRWYTERLPGVRFSARVVPMGGPFQGVQRTVARASTTLPSGYRIVVTVSRPGIDTASRRLVPETSVRVEIR